MPATVLRSKQLSATKNALSHVKSGKAVASYGLVQTLLSCYLFVINIDNKTQITYNFSTQQTIVLLH